MHCQGARLRSAPPVDTADSSLGLLEFIDPAPQHLAPAREELGLNGVHDVVDGAACDDEGAPHDDVHGAPLGLLALHVRAQRADLKLASLVETK
eukprot:186378-Pleurochrysis_carterae.AAC.1